MTNHIIQLTAEQFQALQSGQPITIEPPNATKLAQLMNDGIVEF